MADGPARVILWGTPRCLSTAFLKAMTNVEDSVVWHEPYLYARRIGTDGLDKDKFKALGEKMMEAKGVNREQLFAFAKTLPFGYVGSEVSYQWVKEQLEAEAPGKKLIFNKDMVEGIVDKYDALPEGFRHVFLLRHPLKVLPSFKKMVVSAAAFPDPDLRKLPEVGLMPAGYFYKELCNLYQHVKEKLNTVPIVICTDDLQKNPEGVMKAYCKELNIPYTDKLLKWDNTGGEILQKWMIAKEISIGLDMIHKAAFESTGFGPPKDLPDRAGLDEDVLEIIDKCMPYYEQMHKERMKVEL